MAPPFAAVTAAAVVLYARGKGKKKSSERLLYTQKCAADSGPMLLRLDSPATAVASKIPDGG